MSSGTPDKNCGHVELYSRDFCNQPQKFPGPCLLCEQAALQSERDSAVERVKELEALVQRELPFATAEGRKTWVADARAILERQP
jgi:hypothetical protein